MSRTVWRETKQNLINISDGSPVQCVKGLFTALYVTLKRLLLGVNTDVDFETVRSEKGLSTTLLITHKCVLAPMCLLVCTQISCCAISPWAAFECALIALYLKRNNKKMAWNQKQFVDWAERWSVLIFGDKMRQVDLSDGTCSQWLNHVSIQSCWA